MVKAAYAQLAVFQKWKKMFVNMEPIAQCLVAMEIATIILAWLQLNVNTDMVASYLHAILASLNLTS